LEPATPTTARIAQRSTSRAGSASVARPRRQSASGARIRSAKLTRVCVRMSVSIGRNACDPVSSRPLNTAFPKVAAAPQHRAAAAIERYPRSGWLGPEEFVDAFRIKSDDHLVANDYGRGRTAVIGLDQFADGFEIAAHIAFFERNTSRREVGSRRGAWRSARLAEQKDKLCDLAHKPI